MRRATLAAGLLAAATASAAPLETVTADVALGRPGLVVVELSSEGVCTGDADGWSDPGARERLKEVGATAVSVARTQPAVERMVGPRGLRATTMRFAYRDGVEVDRVCGCMDGETLADWFGAVSTGATAAATLRGRLQAVPTGDEWPLEGWLTLVQLEMCASRLDDAFAAARHVWETVPVAAPHRREIRFTRVAEDLGVLARKHPPAEAALGEMRDALDAAKETDPAAAESWMALNRILLQDDRTIDWFLTHRGDPSKRAVVDRQAPSVFYLLADQGRWVEAAGLIDDPKAWLAIWKRHAGGIDPAVRSWVALQAAGRTKDADKLGKELLKLTPQAACRMIQGATKADVANRSQASVAKRCEDAEVTQAWNAAL